MKGALASLSRRADATGRHAAPKVASLREFLEQHARVKGRGGDYVPYSFAGREALAEIVDTFDLVMGSHTGQPLKDATIDICGGAQFGKTILALNVGCYLTACRFFNWGYYLPDDDLVEGIVDTKFRPDVIEQIDWVGDLMTLGKFEDARRRRIVNRKGAFMVTDGQRKAQGMIRGMGKIPTTFSMDVAMEDEKDDIKEKNSKFLTGRMTASDLRLRCSIGTQRVHGRGQHKQWRDGSQGVLQFTIPSGEIVLEEHWPQVCRMAIDGTPSPDDPRLDYTAEFVTASGRKYAPDPAAHYYLADPETGAPIDRHAPRWVHRRPERIAQRQWSYRISQLGVAGIDLSQIVSRWKDAVADPESMAVFCCDVLALPRNSSQALSESILERSRGTHDLSVVSPPAEAVFAGLDTGERCWFVARRAVSKKEKHLAFAEQIPLGDVVRRTIDLCRLLRVGCLMIDARPHAAEARQICWTLHGLDGFDWPRVNDPEKAKIKLGADLMWDGERGQWLGLKAAVVEFSLKPGQGIIHKLGQHLEAGQTRFYPVIRASRYDTIDRVVNEFLTPAENVIRVIDGELLTDPLIRLPREAAGAPPIRALLERHFQVGSEKDDKGEYVDDCENHLLLANGYSSLAEEIGGSMVAPAAFAYESVGKRGDDENETTGFFSRMGRVLRGAV